MPFGKIFHFSNIFALLKLMFSLCCRHLWWRFAQNIILSNCFIVLWCYERNFQNIQVFSFIFKSQGFGRNITSFHEQLSLSFFLWKIKSKFNICAFSNWVTALWVSWQISSQSFSKRKKRFMISESLKSCFFFHFRSYNCF